MPILELSHWLSVIMCEVLAQQLLRSTFPICISSKYFLLSPLLNFKVVTVYLVSCSLYLLCFHNLGSHDLLSDLAVLAAIA